jgi:hypothetical protein
LYAFTSSCKDGGSDAKLPKDKKVRQGEMSRGVEKAEPESKKKGKWGKFE